MKQDIHTPDPFDAGGKRVADMGFHDAIQSCSGHWAFQTDLSWLLGISWYRFGYRWVIPRMRAIN